MYEYTHRENVKTRIGLYEISVYFVPLFTRRG